MILKCHPHDVVKWWGETIFVDPKSVSWPNLAKVWLLFGPTNTKIGQDLNLVALGKLSLEAFEDLRFIMILSKIVPLIDITGNNDYRGKI